MPCTAILQDGAKNCYHEIVVAKQTKQNSSMAHTTGTRTGRHGGSVLPGDAMAAGQSISPPLVPTQLLQHTRRWEDQENSRFPEAGHFAPHQSARAGTYTAAKSNSTYLCRYFFLLLQTHVPACGDVPIESILVK